MSRKSIGGLQTKPAALEPFRFSGAAGRRYGLDIAAIFAIKLPLLLLIWSVAVRPSIVSPDAVTSAVARMYSTTLPFKPQ